MQIPLQVTFEGTEPSDAVRAVIDRELAIEDVGEQRHAVLVHDGPGLPALRSAVAA